jgi:23S rRNA (uracil1939-C5)-methyltransferase
MILHAENGEENFMNDLESALLQFCDGQRILLTSLVFLHVSNRKGERNRVEEKIVHGAPAIKETLRLPSGEMLHFEISAQAFFQPNTGMAEVLYAKTLEAARLTGKEQVFDLYCGTGTIGLFCASKAKKVYGIELNASAVENAKANAKLNNIGNTEFIAGDAQEILENFRQEHPGAGQPDVVLVDPPRNGLAPKVVAHVAAFGPKRLVYVSCNPASLARDAALFAQNGYRLVSVQPVDQFPQTYHIESVALLIPA